MPNAMAVKVSPFREWFSARRPRYGTFARRSHAPRDFHSAFTGATVAQVTATARTGPSQSAISVNT
ncbi:hypothetical protein ABH935_002967 [Catenulispora sp. GAS73]|uniref:hypothetical protein n=1 Tax=Catenulispora sp. GAS73 TaxID=3156269 RepID=UPI0035160450